MIEEAPIEIDVRDLRKSFGDIEVLKGVSFPVYKGKTTVMLGPSGTGKSVLIKCMVGLYEANSGQIIIDGKDIVGMPDKDLYQVRKKMGKLLAPMNNYI